MPKETTPGRDTHARPGSAPAGPAGPRASGRPGRTTARRALTVAAATAAALLLWGAADLAGIALAVRADGTLQRVGPGAVAAAGLIAGLVAWASLAALERLPVPGLTGRRLRRGWTAIAVVVLVLSLTGPIGAAADTASGSALAGLHLVVAAALILGLGRSARCD